MIHRHHRVLGNREDNRPVNILVVDDAVHRWIHDNPKEAMELGWIVSKHDDPENISVCIPEKLVVKEKRKKANPEQKKERVNTNIRTPKDEQNVLPDLIQAGREAWSEQMGWDEETVPAYFVVCAAFAKALQ